MTDARLISEMDAKDVYHASMSGCVLTLNALLQRNPLTFHQLSLTSSFTETPLHIAALLGHREFATVLLEKKSSFASKLDSSGRLPLHLACAEGHFEIAKALLEADPEACTVADQEERLPLHLAVMRGQVDIIRELIRRRPEAARVTAEGDSPVLHLCVKCGHLESLRAIVQLLDNSSSSLLTMKDGDGNTVLHLAVMLNQKRTIKYLVSLPGAEANANTENNNGLTPLDVLERHCPIRDFKTLEIRDILVQGGVTRRSSNNVVVRNPNNREYHDYRSPRMEFISVVLMVVSFLVMFLAYTYLQAIEAITPKFVLEDHGMLKTIQFCRAFIIVACAYIGLMYAIMLCKLVLRLVRRLRVTLFH